MAPTFKSHKPEFTTLASIRTPRLISTVGWMLAVASVSVILFLTFTPWVQTAAGSGVVTALNPNDRVQEINALVTGRIDEWFVQDGSQVKAGDPIVKIADIDERLLERLQAERGQLIAKLEASESAAATARIDLRRTQELFEKGLAARRDVELARIKVDDFSVAAAEAAASVNRIDVSISRQSEQLVRAPRDGVIVRVYAGDAATLVTAGTPLASFVPLNVERAIELYINGRDVSLIRTGAHVRVQFEGWPAVQFSGWPSVAVGAFDGKVVSIDPSASPGGRFRILVREDPDARAPWPDAAYVRIGSTARGWVLLEEVSVGYELWRQLNDFPPEFPAAASGAAQ